jgi:1-aminocyclopropane-1-carboxylate deaminase/D-cysteine desulfhydrase-like pyridoxal-dependent ACC family enzyme
MAEIHKHEALQARIDRLPRVGLAHLPTPLEFCPNLTAALGGPKIYLKRDDLTGFAFGGNKSRQLEFLFADILARRVDVVVAGGSTQSNWCRQIGAAAAKFGLRAALVLVPGAEPLAAQGNLLLDRLVDAEVSVMESGEVEDLPELLATKAQALQAEGATPFVLSQFDLDAQSLSAVGYVEAAIELDRQFREAAINPSHLYLAGADMTPAGLEVGLRAVARKTRVVTILPIVWNAEGGRYCATEIARIAAATAHRLGLDIEVPITDIISDESFVGAGYGILSPAAREAIELVAGTEGVFLDPIYTAKAMAALIDHVRAGRFAAGESVVFLHTGGTPALFAYATDFATG